MSSSTPIFRIATRGDDFVGITMDNGSISVCLPLGAKYPQTERHRKQTARNLIRVLREFRPSENSILGKMQGTPEDASKAFPFDACITLILDFLDTGEILSTELIESKISGKGKIDWRKTFRKSVPYGLENGEFLYTQFITRNSSRNLDADISKVHRRCLDFAFENVGWLVTDVEYRSNDYALSDIFAESVVRTESQRTFNDRKRKLLSAMTDILMSLQAGEKAEFFTFGTRHFEFVWEGMIDRVFGAPGKKDYFPRANWILASGNRTPAPLEIDSIMFCGDKTFVLDAKYYRYGVTSNPSHLPGAADINKQVTYGDMTAKKLDASVFNAFLLPYEADSKRPGPFEVFGAAEPTWIEGPLKSHHFIVGVLVDTDSLIGCSLSPTDIWKVELSDTISNWHSP